MSAYSTHIPDVILVVLQPHSTLSLDGAHSDLGYGIVYSGWKSVDNYDTCASVFVVLFNGFMSLTSYFDEKYRC